MTQIPIPAELAFLFPNGQPMETGHENFMSGKSEEAKDALVQSAKKVQDCYDEMCSELIAELMVPIGDPERLATILDRLATAASEMAASLRK
jgi:hypothetical protein